MHRSLDRRIATSALGSQRWLQAWRQSRSAPLPKQTPHADDRRMFLSRSPHFSFASLRARQNSNPRPLVLWAVVKRRMNDHNPTLSASANIARNSKPAYRSFYCWTPPSRTTAAMINPISVRRSRRSFKRSNQPRVLGATAGATRRDFFAFHSRVRFPPPPLGRPRTLADFCGSQRTSFSRGQLA